jgi:Tfp pilus assembly ATPase PilU
MEAASSLMDEKQRRLFFEIVARSTWPTLWRAWPVSHEHPLAARKPEVIMRLIPQHIPRIEDINLPTTVLKQIAAESRG